MSNFPHGLGINQKMQCEISAAAKRIAEFEAIGLPALRAGLSESVKRFAEMESFARRYQPEISAAAKRLSEMDALTRMRNAEISESLKRFSAIGLPALHAGLSESVKRLSEMDALTRHDSATPRQTSITPVPCESVTTTTTSTTTTPVSETALAPADDVPPKVLALVNQLQGGIRELKAAHRRDMLELESEMCQDIDEVRRMVLKREGSEPAGGWLI